MTLSREDILNALDLPTEEVEIPRWGGTVLVRAMPMASTRYNLYIEKGGTLKRPITAEETMRRRYIGAVIICALDGDTEEPLFTWADAHDLREKHWGSVLKVATTAFDLASDLEDEEDDDDDDEALELDEDDILIEDAIGETDEDGPDPPKGE